MIFEICSMLGIKTSGQTSRSKKTKARAEKPRTETIEGCLGLGKTTIYSINGRDFVIDDDTWLFGTPAVGVHVRILCNGFANSVPRAKTVQVLSGTH